MLSTKQVGSGVWTWEGRPKGARARPYDDRNGSARGVGGRLIASSESHRNNHKFVPQK